MIASSAKETASSSTKNPSPQIWFSLKNTKTGEEFDSEQPTTSIQNAYAMRVVAAKEFGGSPEDYQVSIRQAPETRADKELTAAERAAELGISPEASALAPYQSTAQAKKGQSGIKEFAQDVATLPLRSATALPALAGGLEGYRNAMGDIDRSAMMHGAAASLLVPGASLPALAGSAVSGAAASELASESVNPERMALSSILGTVVPGALSKGPAFGAKAIKESTSRLGSIPMQALEEFATPEGRVLMRKHEGKSRQVAEDIVSDIGVGAREKFPETQRFREILGQADETGYEAPMTGTLSALRSYDVPNPQAYQAQGKMALQGMAEPFLQSEQQAENQLARLLASHRKGVVSWTEAGNAALQEAKNLRKAGRISAKELNEASDFINNELNFYKSSAKSKSRPDVGHRAVQAYKGKGLGGDLFAKQIEGQIAEEVPGYMYSVNALTNREARNVYPQEAYELTKSLGRQLEDAFAQNQTGATAEWVGQGKKAYSVANEELYNMVEQATSQPALKEELLGLRKSMADKMKAIDRINAKLPKAHSERATSLERRIEGMNASDRASNRETLAMIEELGKVFGPDYAETAKYAALSKAAGMKDGNLPWFTNVPTGLTATGAGLVGATATSNPLLGVMSAGMASPRIGAEYLRGLNAAQQAVRSPYGQTALRSFAPLSQQQFSEEY
jgi:hypothetical protein